MRDFASGMGIKSMAVTGEMYFSFIGAGGTAKNAGCVGLFASNMKEFNPVIVTNLTYPATAHKVLR